MQDMGDLATLPEYGSIYMLQTPRAGGDTLFASTRLSRLADLDGSALALLRRLQTANARAALPQGFTMDNRWGPRWPPRRLIPWVLQRGDCRGGAARRDARPRQLRAPACCARAAHARSLRMPLPPNQRQNSGVRRVDDFEAKVAAAKADGTFAEQPLVPAVARDPDTGAEHLVCSAHCLYAFEVRESWGQTQALLQLPRRGVDCTLRATGQLSCWQLAGWCCVMRILSALNTGPLLCPPTLNPCVVPEASAAPAPARPRPTQCRACGTPRAARCWRRCYQRWWPTRPCTPTSGGPTIS